MGSELQTRLDGFDKSQTISEFENLIHKARSVFPILSRDQRLVDISEPILRNTQLELSDIFVSAEDPTKIEGYIDWRSVQILPLFLQTNIPPFLPLPPFYDYGSHIFSPPENFATLSPADKESVKKELKQANNAKYYEMMRLREIKKMDNAIKTDRKLWRLFEVCTIFGNSLTPFRNRLYQLFENWSSLGLPGACPYSITEAEVQRHEQQEERYMATLDVEDIVKDKLSTNYAGWVANDQWEDKTKANQELHEDFVQTVSKDMGVEAATQMWPFPPK